MIDIRLPISGSLDDPQFSIGGLIVQVIVNLFTKAVTAPFALLSAVFGGGDEELSTVTFAAGSAALGDAAQKRIDTLGKALADRPALKLDVGGRADPATDREALRRAAVADAMRREKMKSLVAAGAAPCVGCGGHHRRGRAHRWLTAAYREAPLPERAAQRVRLLKEVPPPRWRRSFYQAPRSMTTRALARERARGGGQETPSSQGVAATGCSCSAPARRRRGGAASPMRRSRCGEARCGEARCGEARCGEDRCGEARCGEARGAKPDAAKPRAAKPARLRPRHHRPRRRSRAATSLPAPSAPRETGASPTARSHRAAAPRSDRAAPRAARKIPEDHADDGGKDE